MLRALDGQVRVVLLLFTSGLLFVAGHSPSCLAADCTPTASGLVSWWQGEGDATDFTGNNPGTMQMSVDFGPGLIGQAFSFTGTSTSYVEVPDSPSLQLGEAVTIEFWVKRKHLGTGTGPFADYIVEKGGDWTGNKVNYGVALHVPEYNNCLHFTFAGGWRGGGSVPDTNTWHHCAVVARHGDADPVFYVDGQPQPVTYRQGAATINLFTSARPLHIGALVDPVTGWAYYSEALVDELSIYNRALGPEEIQKIYAAGASGKCATQPAPVVFSVTPNTATPDTLVEVSGQNFSPIPNGNTVFFGAVAGAVTAATETNLTVRVPQGATHAPVTVTARRLTGAAPSPFVPMSSEYRPALDTTSFTLTGNLAAGNGPLKTAIADLDGDGKPDLVVANAYEHCLAIMRNIGAAGALSPTSFAARVTLPVGSGTDDPLDVVAVDIDGDRKLDLVAPSRSQNLVYVFRNQASPGSLGVASFAPAFTLPAGADSRYLAAGDLNGDGRPEIVIANYGANTVSILCRTNLSTTMTAESFAPAFQVPTLSGPYGVAITDLDGDLRPDLAVSHQSSPTVLVLQNLGQNGLLNVDSFTNQVQLPAMQGTDLIEVADLDGDHRPDLVIGSYLAETLAVIRNEATPGLLTSASFGTRVDFGAGGWIHGVDFSDLNGDGKPDVASVTELPSHLSVHQNLSTPGSFTSSSLSSRLDFASGWNAWGVAVGDLDADGRPDIVFVNAYDDNLALYRNTAYGLQPPRILSQPADLTVGVGETATFAVMADGDNLGYQWYFQQWAVEEATNASLSLPNVQTNQAGPYFVVVTNAVGSVTSSVATLTVPAYPPAIVTQPRSTNAFVGSSVTFRVTASGSPPLSYQWHKDGVPIGAATASAYTRSNLQLADSGSYAVAITNSFGWAVSSNAVLTVRPPPVCVPPGPGLISWWRGQTNTLDAWGPNNASLYWYSTKYGPGKVGQAFSAPLLTVPDSPAFQFGTGFTAHAWVMLPTSPGTGARTIISKWGSQYLVPNNQNSFFLGTTNNGQVVFIVSANGSLQTQTTLVTTQQLALNQWYFVAATYDGAALRVFIDGAVAAQTTYSAGIFPAAANLGIGMIPSPQTYTAPFSGYIDELCLYNRALSEPELADIAAADFVGFCLSGPVLLTQPQDQEVPTGEDVKFSVECQGARPFRIQWFKNNVPMNGATNLSLVLPKVGPDAVANYSIQVTNAFGSAVSTNAALKLLPARSCTDIPAGLISWWPADGSSVDAMGLNNATLAGASGVYATGKVGLAFSSAGAIVNTPGPTLNFGKGTNFTLEAWVRYESGVNLRDPFPYLNFPILDKRVLTGVTSMGYSLSMHEGRLAFLLATAPANPNYDTNSSLYISPGPDLRDGMYHHVAVSVERDSPTGGKLYVDGRAVLTFDPTSRNGDLSNSGYFRIGTAALRWPDYLFPGFVDEAAVYRRALSETEIATLWQAGAAGKCKVKPAITTQPMDQTVMDGEPFTFSVAATGSPKLFYQWRVNGLNIGRATNATLVVSNATLGSAGSYSVLVTNFAGSVLSSNALLTVLPQPPYIITQPAGTNVFVNENVMFSVGAGGSSPLSFQWRKDGADLAGETQVNLSLYAVKTNDSGVYSVVISNAAGTVTSAEAALAVKYQRPYFIREPEGTNVLEGRTIVLSGIAGGSVPLTYSWLKNDKLLPGETNNILVFPSAQLSDSGTYVLRVANGGGRTASMPARVIVRPAPTTPVFTQVNAGFERMRGAAMAWGDYDNDSKLDVIISGDGGAATAVTALYHNEGNGSFSRKAFVFVGYRSGSADWGDMDNDGYLDVVLTGLCPDGLARIYRNQAGTNFVQIFSFPSAYDGQVRWADFDNDGFLDFATTGAGSSSKMYRNLGGTNFVQVNPGLSQLYYGSVDWADFNRDGRLDLLLIGMGGGGEAYGSLLYRNEGGGQFTRPWGISTAYDPGSWLDVDNDGWPDMVLESWGSQETLIYRNDHGDNFVPTASLPIGPSAAGDFNNDGWSDLVIRGSIQKNASASEWSAARLNIPEIDASALSGEIISGDFDNDGKLDLLVAGESSSGTVLDLYRNEVAANNSPPAAPQPLRTIASPTKAVLLWQAATDDLQTNGLTYNVRIGTMPGGCDVVSPMSAPSGMRRVVRTGNAGPITRFYINGLTPGKTYYWSVQGIDNSFAGSSFAPEQSFVAALSPNQPPTATNLVVATAVDRTLFIEAEAVLAGCSDPENGPLSMVSVSAYTSQGGLAYLIGGRVEYIPPANFWGTDIFTYVITDVQGLQASGIITVKVAPPGVLAGTFLPLLTTPSGWLLRFSGVAGLPYTLYRAPAAEGPWTKIATIQPNNLGMADFEDTNSPAAGAFYRVSYP